jgi:hypothetical protein
MRNLAESASVRNRSGSASLSLSLSHCPFYLEFRCKNFTSALFRCERITDVESATQKQQMRNKTLFDLTRSSFSEAVRLNKYANLFLTGFDVLADQSSSASSSSSPSSSVTVQREQI